MRDFAAEQAKTRLANEKELAKVQLQYQQQTQHERSKIESNTAIQTLKLQLEQQERTEACNFAQRQLEMQHAERMAGLSSTNYVPNSHYVPISASPSLRSATAPEYGGIQLDMFGNQPPLS